MFTDREKFIQAITIFMVSPDARKLPIEERQLALDFIRKTHCLTVTDEVWAEISKEINANKVWILSSINEYKNTDINPEYEKSDALVAEESEDKDNTDDDESDIDDKPEEQPKKKFGFNFGKNRGEKKSSGGKTISSLFKKS